MSAPQSPGRTRLKNRSARLARIVDLQNAPLFLILAEFDLIAAALEVVRQEDPAAWDEAVATVQSMRGTRSHSAGETLQ